MLGVLLIRKEIGGTSHDVVNSVRRKFSTKRVGHAGTLDPLATGLLVVAVGPATRFLQYLPLEPKEYVADIRFGQATSTFDAEGEVTSTGPVPEDLEAAILAQVPQFTGLIQQLPPMYSAVKKNGQPLYHYARQGQVIEREPRTVHISAFEIVSQAPQQASVRIVCSGGTYIRSLAHDLGQALGCGAHLGGLVRTGVGRFRLEQAKLLEDLTPEDLMPLNQVLPPTPLLSLSAADVDFVRDGRAIPANDAPPEAKIVALLDLDGQVLGIARREGDLLQPECVLPREVVPLG